MTVVGYWVTSTQAVRRSDMAFVMTLIVLQKLTMRKKVLWKKHGQLVAA
jgi:hypothetical protein